MLLAVAAHTAMDGRVPALGALVLLGVPVGLAAAALSARRCATPVLLVALSVLQLGLHEAFTLLGGPVPSAALSRMATGTHAAHGSPLSGLVGTAASAGAGAPMTMGGHGSIGMLLAHALATVATALLLAHGERVVFGWYTRFAPVTPGRLPDLPVPGRTEPTGTRRRARSRYAAGGAGVRGPPPRTAAVVAG